MKEVTERQPDREDFVTNSSAIAHSTNRWPQVNILSDGRFGTLAMGSVCLSGLLSIGGDRTVYTTNLLLGPRRSCQNFSVCKASSHRYSA